MVARQRAELTFGKHLAGGHQGHHSPSIKLSTCINLCRIRGQKEQFIKPDCKLHARGRGCGVGFPWLALCSRPPGRSHFSFTCPEGTFLTAAVWERLLSSGQARDWVSRVPGGCYCFPRL